MGEWFEVGKNKKGEKALKTGRKKKKKKKEEVPTRGSGNYTNDKEKEIARVRRE